MGNFEPTYDLFGEPVPKNFGRRGRPEHVATSENVNKVSMLLAQGWPNVRIARTLGITIPTLKRHYKFQLKDRDVMRDRIEARGLVAFYEQGLAGNVAAMKEFFRRHDAAAAPLFDEKVKDEQEKEGKKQRVRREAGAPPDEWESVIPRARVQ